MDRGEINEAEAERQERANDKAHRAYLAGDADGGRQLREAENGAWAEDRCAQADALEPIFPGDDTLNDPGAPLMWTCPSCGDSDVYDRKIQVVCVSCGNAGPLPEGLWAEDDRSVD